MVYALRIFAQGISRLRTGFFGGVLAVGSVTAEEPFGGSGVAGDLSVRVISSHPQDGPDADVRIRIDERQVTFQIIMNLAFVDEIVDVPREEESTLDPAEYASVEAALADFYTQRNQVRIDGVAVQPLVDAFEVDPGDLSLLPLFPAMGTRALIKVRLVLTYSAKSPPQRVKMVWGTYPPDLVLAGPDGAPPIQINAQLTAGGIDSIVEFRKHEPEFTWHAGADTHANRFLAVPEPPKPDSYSIPVVSLILLLVGLFLGIRVLVKPLRPPFFWLSGFVLPSFFALAIMSRHMWVVEADMWNSNSSRLPTEAMAAQIFKPLHANIYRAFDYNDESDIYDALARSATGELLDDLYNQIYQSLIMQEEGGAVSRVQEVRVMNLEVNNIGLLPPQQQPGFHVVARWQVDGAVFHWGHSHERTNEYLARYTVAEEAAGWRIAESQILEQFRVAALPLQSQ